MASPQNGGQESADQQTGQAPDPTAAETATRPGGLDRLWARLRSLFVPSVSVAAVLATVGSKEPESAVKQLYEWERDRLFTLAKGAAAAAVTVLTGLAAASFENKVLESAEGVVYLAASLVALLLCWSGFVLTGLRRLAEEYSLALSLVRSP